jgi:hypothetical protein
MVKSHWKRKHWSNDFPGDPMASPYGLNSTHAARRGSTRKRVGGDLRLPKPGLYGLRLCSVVGGDGR